jgi:hypothetical protein
VFRPPGLGGFRATPDDLLELAEERLASTGCRAWSRARGERVLGEECARLAAEISAISVFVRLWEELAGADAAGAADPVWRWVWWLEKEAHRG